MSSTPVVTRDIRRVLIANRGEIAVRMAKAAAEATYSFAADRAIQFHGGFGFTHDCDAGLHRRAAIFQASQFGDAAWQRFKLAPLLLG